MSNKYKSLYNLFVKNNFSEREEIEYEVYMNLNKDDTEVETQDGKNIFYKTHLENNFDENQVNQAIQLKMLDELEKMNEKQNTMKNIMVFWLILTIINLCCVIYIISKLSDAFK